MSEGSANRPAFSVRDIQASNILACKGSKKYLLIKICRKDLPMFCYQIILNPEGFAQPQDFEAFFFQNYQHYLNIDFLEFV